jgi:hypothetical protein
VATAQSVARNTPATPTGGSIPAVNANGYKLLGYVVWQGGKWYLRRRLPSTRMLAATTFAVLAASAAAALLVRRATS